MAGLHFTVTGAFLTEFCRNQFIENRDFDRGMVVLMKSVIGIPESTAKQILRGELKLEGDSDSGIYTVPDNAIVEIYSPYREIRNIQEASCGWISPSGILFACESHSAIRDHIEMSENILAWYPDMGFGEFDTRNVIGTDPEDILLANGWCKFAPNNVFSRLYKMSDTQKNMLDKFCEATKEKFGNQLDYNGLAIGRELFQALSASDLRKGEYYLPKDMFTSRGYVL